VPALTQGPAKGQAPERTCGPQSEGDFGSGKQPLGEPNGRRPALAPSPTGVPGLTQGPAKGKAPERCGPGSQLEGRPSCDDLS
jgi:hypothetical protein